MAECAGEYIPAVKKSIDESMAVRIPFPPFEFYKSGGCKVI
jgi:hypothetical protein